METGNKQGKHQLFFIFIAGALLFICSASSSFGKEADLVKEYIFYPDSAEDLRYEAPEKLKENGRTYKLKEVSCELLEDNSITVTRTVRTNNRDEYRKEILHTTEDGRKIPLTADTDIDWKETGAEPVIITREYAEGGVPQRIESMKEEGEKEVSIELTLTSSEQIASGETFTASAAFYSPEKGESKYSFNGKVVTVKNSPVWPGYEEDVCDYLDEENAQITGGRWTGDYRREGDMYVRYAQFTGTRGRNLYRAVYTETDETVYRYTAEVAYMGTDPGKMLRGQAIAVYEQTAGIREGILIGAGALILALAASAILFVIRRRRREDNA